ncbi:sensor histidine kinase [Mucilaginibacter pedocola]|uniref:histidine kinase n=1 Tax=Mucilaginibacter pedocola TaxID=1792845 RepID=A0A1S9PHH9_9SPHI|nr:HAMP domain-containing sensor histidine kinase [Mucilaginibacter pedocola]OOQ60407.1 hypothetical protein BC343_25675 [Mucilaginibacter pedocola]
MTKRPGNFARIINRIFIIFLLFTFLVTTGSFFLRHTINQKLERLSMQAAAPPPQHQISALIVELDLAENSFQRASANGKAADLATYKQRLDTIFRSLDSAIGRYQKGSSASLPDSRHQIEKSLQLKLQLSKQLLILRSNFDSLLRVTTMNNIHRGTGKEKMPALPSLKADTVISTQKEANRSGLISRLKEALQATRSVKVLTVREKSNNKPRYSKHDNRALLLNLSSEYGRMAASGQALILANLNLLIKLRQLTRQVQDIDRIAYEKSRASTLKAYALTTKDLNTFTGIALAAVLIFIALLLVYIRRAGWAERRLVVESDRAIKLAGQRSEILAIMSHEIRNKLMAINGAVFTLKRTGLLPPQEQKVAAINLASGLILETVNNVLDASKLEQGYSDTRKCGPFVPAEAIIEAVEAMRFMAENKALTLDLELGPEMKQTILGDSFRLKQVLLNLLSNAIKYTDSGSVRIAGHLRRQDSHCRLNVEVGDTGSGIPKHLQAKLFTPYYQAAGKKPGTGLGLYLCRELIRQQGGEISIESDSGAGTVIRFFIVYNLPMS